MASTDTQHLEKLRTYWKKNRAFPSMAKLCDVVGLSSTASVFDLVTRLKAEGFVERVEGLIAPTKRFFARPMLGQVRAGLPQPAPDDDFEVLTVDDYLVPDPRHRGDPRCDMSAGELRQRLFGQARSATGGTNCGRRAIRRPHG